MHKIEHKFPYKWKLSDGYPAKGISPNGLKVFGSFVCGGGSTMGYKLAGFDHIGGIELTPHYSELYKKNHHPKYFYTQDIREWLKREDLPKELYTLDVFDGSPPCASFSTCGARERKWGKTKDYEGITQKTDDLVFFYCDAVEKLKPKTFIMENVSGLIKGNAKQYAKDIVSRLKNIGYQVQLFSLNAATMGVPQMRQRVFVVGCRNDIYKKPLRINFNEPTISFGDATHEYWEKGGTSIEKYSLFKKWKEIDFPNETQHKKRFSLVRPSLNKPCNTLVESASCHSAASVCHPIYPRKLNRYEASVLQSYPIDYDFLDQEPLSAIGRSVPPVMMAHLSHQIFLQWLSNA